MADRHIICVEPASGRGELVVVQVEQDGTQPLDLRLVGCEGENPYVASIKQRNLAKLKLKFKGSDEEWAAVLSHFLLQKPVTHNAGLLTGVRLVYTLKDDLELSFRRDVQGIKVTLGEIVLPRDDEYEFNPFEWAQASAKAHAETLKELADLKTRATSEQDTIAKLNAQLDDFIKTKNETETAMLQQFMQLLNEKKRKIRDQSRLLATAKVDSSVASAVQSTRTGPNPRKVGTSRQSKRKAPAQAAEADVQSGPDSDQMDVDPKEEPDSDDAPAATPEASEDETDEEEATAPSVRAKSSETLGANSAKASQEGAKSSDKPPPKRELPFGRPATRSKPSEKKPEPAVGDDDEDATDDEEL
ncbi:hypothetical protein HBH56_086130 [Parastagonospora nodorum]|uniref:Uncharacterized protein n=1 Tax=Phaeosphaeria nodorum (strain SN15 / ATCC MYA-4574 / FGSC 10173) TaxID=321614 RepID=A0A7U2F1X6_PHANO|nr:hypothetical protein HBH56_086130 [Parastagonospora nodorum]QRC96951.1 hypothetical protein JI435_018240 [Parastagonospora nodorum SN15]KAH3921170.1 hypothetical protein HBH54_244590 [Parastagonospora nodorum]KAH4007601.1 hypothetical protein HBI10_000520 [Parastagonospora nodorum]KAH4016455.1 hypothetical protein HBI13_148540 [Parastagonospora nodorum]